MQTVSDARAASRLRQGARSGRWEWLGCIQLPAVRDTDWVEARFGHD